MTPQLHQNYRLQNSYSQSLIFFLSLLKTKLPLRFAALVLWFGTVSCTDNYLIPQEKVKEVLTEYGKQNPENEVLVETNMGNIKLKLYEETPLHRANFIRLIKQGFYDDDSEFYRVIDGFMIQGGKGAGYDKFLVPPEFTPKYYHKRGALAMAHRDADNPDFASSPTEFYIVEGQTSDSSELDLTKLTPAQIQDYTSIKIGGCPSLDGKYTVFGEVSEGMDVVLKIAAIETYNEKPKKPIRFKLKIIENAAK